MGCIYLIRNLRNNKCYIGKTINPDKRISAHLNCTSQGSRLIKRAVEKYGRESFVYEILHDGIIPELLDSYEVEAIKTYNSLAPAGYNLRTGGEGGKLTVESRKILSNLQTERMSNPQNRLKISESLRERTHAEETRRKMSIAKMNKSGTRRLSYYYDAREFFFSLPSTMSIKEKRKRLIQKFSPVVKPGTLRMWVRQWVPNRQSQRESAIKYLSSLPLDMSIEEKRKLLRTKYPGYDRKTIYNWTRQWQSELTPKGDQK